MSGGTRSRPPAQPRAAGTRATPGTGRANNKDGRHAPPQRGTPLLGSGAWAIDYNKAPGPPSLQPGAKKSKKTRTGAMKHTSHGDPSRHNNQTQPHGARTSSARQDLPSSGSDFPQASGADEATEENSPEDEDEEYQEPEDEEPEDEEPADDNELGDEEFEEQDESGNEAPEEQQAKRPKNQRRLPNTFVFSTPRNVAPARGQQPARSRSRKPESSPKHVAQARRKKSTGYQSSHHEHEPAPSTPRGDDIEPEFNPQVLFTPFVLRVNPRDPSKPLFNSQSPLTQRILEHACHKYRAWVVGDVGFPEANERRVQAAKAFVDACFETNASTRAQRFQADEICHDTMLKMIKRTDTQVRGELVATARTLVGILYGLDGKNANSVKKRVGMLLEKGNFTYKEIECNVDGSVKSRSGPYHHPIFLKILRQEVFINREQMAVSETTARLFNPIPPAAIALIATVIQCALRDWETGIHRTSKGEIHKLEHAMWSPIYQYHLLILNDIRNKRPDSFRRWLTKLWAVCWESTPHGLQPAAMEAFVEDDELENFSDVEDAEDSSDADEPAA